MAFFGTSGNDTLNAADLLDLTPPATQLHPIWGSEEAIAEGDATNQTQEYTVYLDGREGFDEYQVNAEAVRRYPRITFNSAGFVGDSDETSVVKNLHLPDLSAQEFTYYRHANQLIMRHHETGHEVQLQNVWPVLGGIDREPEVQIQFSNGGISLSELASVVAAQPHQEVSGGIGWNFPIDIQQLESGLHIPLHPDHLTLIQAGSFSLVRARPSYPDLRLSFIDRDTDESKQLILEHYGVETGTIDNVLISNSEINGQYTQIQAYNDFSPSRNVDVTSIVSDSLRPMGHPLLRGHTSIFELHNEEVASGSGDSGETNSCTEAGRTLRELFVVLDQYPYQTIRIDEQEAGETAQAAGYNSEYRIEHQQGDSTECLLQYWGVPQGFLFAYDATLGGWPVARGDVITHSDTGLLEPHWLLPRSNPALVVGNDYPAVSSAGHPVFYNFNPELVLADWMPKEAFSTCWDIDYGDNEIRRLDSQRADDYLEFSIAQRNPDGSIQSSTPYLAVTYSFPRLQLKASHDEAAPFYLQGGNYGLKIKLSAPYGKGFLTERAIARQLTVSSLGRYGGIYFQDGFKSMSEIREWISDHPLTIVPLEKTGTNQWSATGNALNNIIPVQLRSFGQYTINSEKGDDLILINGGIWASKMSFPVTWSTNSTRTRDVNIDGEAVTLTELDIQATPVTSPPPPTGYEMDINLGTGQDVVDVNGAANVRIVESDGQDSIFIQHFAFADLTAVRNGLLFLKDIYSAEVQPVLFSSATDSVVTTLAEADSIFLWSSRSNPGRYIAKLSSDSVTEIHFADGKAGGGCCCMV